MQPFDQDESAYTATAKTIQFSASDQYDPTKLDNPVRKKTNYGLIAANVRMSKRAVCL